MTCGITGRHFSKRFSIFMRQLKRSGFGVINYRGLRQRYSVKSRGAIAYSNFTLEIPLRPHGTIIGNKETGSLHLKEEV